MAHYVIKLPHAIPDDLFSNLAGDVNNDLKRLISNDYSRVQKLDETEAETPRKAITQVLFRRLGDGRQSRVFTRIFGRTAGQYAFTVPEKGYNDAETGKRLSPQAIDTFQKMELAIDIAEARGQRPEDCYGDAVDMVNLHNHRATAV